MRFIYVTLSVFLVSCTTEVKQQKETPSEYSIEKKISIVKEEKNIPIKASNFLGIQPGDAIQDHVESLQKGKIRKGNEILEVYNIEIDGAELGYILEDPEEKGLVGKITIQSDKVETEKGAKVGMSFLRLKEVYPDLSADFSGSEEKFFALTSQYKFELRYKKIDAENKPEEALVSEIIIL